jgi:GPI mannosyltransferase 3
MSISTPEHTAISGAEHLIERDLPRAEGDRRVGLAILAVVLLVGGVLRLWLGIRLDDVYWSDETYKSLEQAHRLVFGYGIVPWEFTDGANNWAWPAVLAGIFKFASVVGLSHPSEYIGLARVVLAAAGVATAFASFRLARSYGASTFTASAGAALFALAAPAIYFAPRALSETASTLPVALGLALALQPRARPRQVCAGASLLGLAVMLRFLNAFFAVALVVMLIARRDRRAAVTAGTTLLVWALAFGMLDWLTWGGWFHSAITYLRFNLVEGRASGWGTSPFGYYWDVLLGSFGAPAAILLVALCLLSVRRAPGLFLTAAIFVLAHSYVPHKEGRFLLPVLAVLCSLAAIGLEELGRLTGRFTRRAAMAAILVTITFSTVHLPDLTYADVGQSGFPPALSAYGRGAEATRLLLKAHSVPDLCGLRIEGITWVFTGGYTWLHRQVPLENPDSNLRNPGVFNYLIAPDGTSPRGDVVARDNGWALTRLPGEGCPAGPPEWSVPTSVTY